ncbi:MAG: nitrogen fixation protein FixH [Gammaproteobacteria bacterium]|nr:nitrogen fixation protein FixH [Gammaproteobacteria bacterium]
MSNSQPFFSQSSNKALRNPWVIGWLSILLIVILVNAAFITTAFMTNPGLVDENYYEKGQDHERTVRTKIANRARLGWQIDLKTTEKISVNKTTTIHLDLKNRDGNLISADAVTLIAYRPSDVNADFSQKMENLAPGRFVTTIIFPLKGVWDIRAMVRSGDDALDTSRRINVSD